jgi:hypothetical protein
MSGLTASVSVSYSGTRDTVTPALCPVSRTQWDTVATV